MSMIDYKKHLCGECQHWYPCASEADGGACEEECRPCAADETACYCFRRVRAYVPDEKADKATNAA
jgi:hypothetical protein